MDGIEAVDGIEAAPRPYEAVTTEGHLYTWGSGSSGQLGHGGGGRLLYHVEFRRDDPSS